MVDTSPVPDERYIDNRSDRFIDSILRERCKKDLERYGGNEPSEPVETPSFSLAQARLAEELKPALTRAEEWLSNRGREDDQMGLFGE